MGMILLLCNEKQLRNNATPLKTKGGYIMYEVVMEGLFEISYTVIKGVTENKAMEVFHYLMENCSQEYFDNLLVTDVIVKSGNNILTSINL